MCRIQQFKAAKALKQALLVAIACFTIAYSAFGAILITEVDSAGSSSSYAGDWFELTNTGAAAVNITGWKVDDNSHTFASALTLSAIAPIAPGQSVVFLESPAGSTAGFINTWFGGSPPAGFTLGTYTGSGIGLGSGGDEVNIYDGSGVLQANVAFGAAPVGATFDNTALANGYVPLLSTASVVGMNGAFASSGGEVGSPGAISQSVPEPCSALLLVAGAGVLTASRVARIRRRA